EKNKVLATLNEISLELAAMPPAADINDYIAKKLMSISRAVYVGVNHYNKDTRQLEFAKANTASHLLNEVNRILGRNVGSIKYDISEAMYKEITGEVVGYRRTLHEVSFGAIGKKAGAVIQRLFSIDHFIGMALVVENELIGTAIMAIGKDTPAVSQELLRSFSHVASVTLRRRQAESQLLAYQEQLRALTLDLTLVEERERRRIAAELHDQIGQNLALCKLKVAALEKGLSREKVKSELSALRRLLEVSIQGARSLVFDLSPPVLYELGFQAALEWLAEWIGEQYQIPVEFESRGAGEFLESDRQVILFQVVRELLVNVGKHSQASRAKVILSLAERSLHIQVNDDGRGFDASQIYDAKAQKGGFGFFSMRERLNFLGGGIDIKSKPGKGTQIVLTVPQGTPPPAGKKEDA
ncbi:MAG: sensor histidine kinase, partial [Acidobacteriota bacterium]|nr:sensor histidine kinase [Acidobacteriota bacterium]